MGLFRIPLIALAALGLAAAMAAPFLLAVASGDAASAGAFAVGIGASVLAAGLIGLPLYGRTGLSGARSALLSLLAVWTFMPALAAIPVYMLTPEIGRIGAYFEMVSFLTTTAASVYETVDDKPQALLLWRAILSWLGGYATLVAGFAILQPLNLGGFEVERTREPGAGGRAMHRLMSADRDGLGMGRLRRAVGVVTPAFTLTTGALAALLIAAGQQPFEAVAHAMGVVSTSGVTVTDAGFAGAGGIGGEVFVVLALALVATRAGATGLFSGRSGASFRDYARRQELTLFVIAVGGATLLLFARHWIGALELRTEDTLGLALRSLWGAVFMSVSFITTTGYESAEWSSARDWSGLANAGLLLLGLAAIGGGAATTAGGVKLLRAAVLFRHSVREMDRLVHPHAIVRQGSEDVSARRENVVLAWVFLMMFTGSLAVAALALSLEGVPFESALMASIAALSNVGPALLVIGDAPVGYAGMQEPALLTLSAAMVTGRMETLALVAFLNPEYWRR